MARVLSNKTKNDAWPYLCDDAAALPLLNEWRTCLKCGLPAPILFSDVKHFCTTLGYRMWRLRIVVRCRECGKESTYRVGGQVIKQGEYVRD